MLRMEIALFLGTMVQYIADVAEQSGYGDDRVFKKAEGITPSQYRRDF